MLAVQFPRPSMTTIIFDRKCDRSLVFRDQSPLFVRLNPLFLHPKFRHGEGITKTQLRASSEGMKCQLSKTELFFQFLAR